MSHFCLPRSTGPASFHGARLVPWGLPRSTGPHLGCSLPPVTRHPSPVIGHRSSDTGHPSPDIKVWMVGVVGVASTGILHHYHINTSLRSKQLREARH